MLGGRGSRLSFLLHRISSYPSFHCISYTCSIVFACIRLCLAFQVVYGAFCSWLPHWSLKVQWATRRRVALTVRRSFEGHLEVLPRWSPHVLVLSRTTLARDLISISIFVLYLLAFPSWSTCGRPSPEVVSLVIHTNSGWCQVANLRWLIACCFKIECNSQFSYQTVSVASWWMVLGDLGILRTVSIEWLA